MTKISLEDIIAATDFVDDENAPVQQSIRMTEIQGSSDYKDALKPCEIFHLGIGCPELYKSVTVVRDAINRYWLYSYDILSMCGLKWSDNPDLHAERILMRPYVFNWNQQHFLMSRPQWVLKCKELTRNPEYSTLYNEIVILCHWLITIETSEYKPSNKVKLYLYTDQDLRNELKRRADLEREVRPQ